MFNQKCWIFKKIYLYSMKTYLYSIKNILYLRKFICIQQNYICVQSEIFVFNEKYSHSIILFLCSIRNHTRTLF